MKRVLFGFLFFVLILFILLELSIAIAHAYTLTGGTDAQRATVTEALSGLPVNAVESSLGQGITYHIENVARLSTANRNMFVGGVTEPTGYAYRGHVYLAGQSPYLTRSTEHETGHEAWFGLSFDKRSQWFSWFPASDGKVWTLNAGEHFAESFRVTFAGGKLRTKLAPVASAKFVALLGYSRATSQPSLPYPDIDSADEELVEAVKYARDRGWIRGFANGTFGPYIALTHRHVALIMIRIGHEAPAGWKTDFRPVTRAEVQAAFPWLKFLDARGGEAFARSQLVRVLWRAR